MRARLLLLCLILACGGGSGAGTKNTLVPGPDAGGFIDASGEADNTTHGEGRPGPTIDTTVTPDHVKAGESVTVTCTGIGFDAKGARLVVHVASEVPASGDGDAATGTPDAISAPDVQYPPDTSLPDGVSVDGNQVRFTRPGLYEMFCWSEEMGIVDPEPAAVQVEVGDPVNIETAVSPASIKAGEWVQVQCSATDAFGNPIEAAFSFALTPAEGTTVSGLAAQLTRQGTYHVACTMPGLSDLTPAAVTVSPNVPKKLLTSANPAVVSAGESSEISCQAVDFYDNPVSNFPFSLVIPVNMKLSGKTVSSAVAGVYTVQCVPENMEWKYFQLVPANVTVVPGKPVAMSLTVTPKKACYGTGEKITVVATAWDKYDNMVPDAQLATPEIDPDNGGVVPLAADPTKTFILKDEGHYTLTFRLLAAPEVWSTLDVCVEGSGPLLTILYPPRGATISGKPSVTIIGQVNDPQSGISDLTVAFNGSEKKQVFAICTEKLPPKCPEIGYFTYTVSIPQGLSQGLNTFTVEVVNGVGTSASTTQGFYFSYAWYISKPDQKKTWVFDAIRALLGQQFFDDGVHDPTHPDDLATIIEAMVANLNLGALIPSPVAEFNPYKVYLSNVHFDKPTVKLQLYDGGILLYVFLKHLSMNVAAKATCKVLWFDVCPDFSGTVSVDEITVVGQENLWFEKAADPNGDGKIHAKLKDIQVQLSGIDIKIDGILGWLLSGLVSFITNQFTGQIEQMIEQQAASMVDKTITSLFDKFNISQTFEIPAVVPGMKPTSITVYARPYGLDVKSQGVYVGLDGAFFSNKGVSHEVLGSIAHKNCLDMTPPPAFSLPGKSEIELALFDDLLNEALFSIWWSGSLNLTIGKELLKDVDLSQYGITDLSVALDFYLPPILTDCTPDGELQAQIGDLYADVTINFNGLPLKIGAFIEAALAAEIFVSDNPATGQREVAAKLLGLREFLIDIMSIELCNDLGMCEDKTEMKPIMEKLIKEQLVAQIEPKITDKVLASFAIPAIDLSTLSPDLPAGVELQFAIEDLWRAFYVGSDGKAHSLAFTAVGGHLE